MLGRHFALDRFSRFSAGKIEARERFELALHLCRGCGRCWSAVSDIAPGSVRLSHDPVAEALYHLVTPQSRAILVADHLTAVEGARRRPFGFAFLLIEEAFAIGFSKKATAPLEDDVFEIIGALRPRRSERPLHQDLHALAQANVSIVRTAQGRLDEAREAWLAAERHRQAGTSDERCRVSVLEARAVLAVALGDYRRAKEILKTGITVLVPDHALRRFELYSRLAEVAIAAGARDRLPAILARAIHLLAEERASVDPVARARAIYKRAALTAYLASRLEPNVGELVPAIRWAAADLADASELFATAVTPWTQTRRLLCLARLYTFLDPQRAMVTYLEALARVKPEGHLFLAGLAEYAAAKSALSQHVVEAAAFEPASDPEKTCVN